MRPAKKTVKKMMKGVVGGPSWVEEGDREIRNMRRHSEPGSVLQHC
jgi:hypothetical protein